MVVVPLKEIDETRMIHVRTEIEHYGRFSGTTACACFSYSRFTGVTVAPVNRRKPSSVSKIFYILRRWCGTRTRGPSLLSINLVMLYRSNDTKNEYNASR